MKNQKLLFLGSALLVSTLVGCGGGNATLTTEKAEEKIATFDKALSGTVKATYHADYKLDVESESALWTSGWCGLLDVNQGIFDIDIKICNFGGKNIYRIYNHAK